MEEPKAKSKSRIFIVIGVGVAVAVGVFFALFFLLGWNKNSLVGRWHQDSSAWGYNFTSNTEGEYGTDSSMPSKFTYSEDGKSITIKYENDDKETTYEYRIEGDKLILTDRFGVKRTYIKQ